MKKMINPLENTWTVPPSEISSKKIVLQRVYENMHIVNELNWHCDCGLYVEPEWKYCPKCGNRLWELQRYVKVNNDYY